VTVNGVSAGSFEIGEQYASVAIVKKGTDEWIINAAQSNKYQYLGTSGTISSAASVEFTTAGWFDGTYKELIFKFIDILPATDSVNLTLTASTDGGSTYLAGTNYDSSGIGRNAAVSTVTVNTGGVASMTICANTSIGNAANEHYSGSLSLFDPSSANHKSVVYACSYKVPAGDSISFNGAGRILTTSAVDAIKFAMSSGNISSGEILVYGVRT
jgi:hypothetical protein